MRNLFYIGKTNLELCKLNANYTEKHAIYTVCTKE